MIIMGPKCAPQKHRSHNNIDHNNIDHKLDSEQLRIQDLAFLLEIGVFTCSCRCDKSENVIRWTIQLSSIFLYFNSDFHEPVKCTAGDDVLLVKERA